jgi:GNAT superfamily N-acetyltransferase
MEPRPLLADEIAVGAETLAAAFEDDPLFRFLLPSPGARERWLLWIQTLALRDTHAAGGAYTLAPELAVMGVFPAGAWPRPLRSTIALASLPPGLPPWPLVRYGAGIDRAIRAAHPKAPHLYLYVLGVHPSHKGKGLGGTLVRHARDLAGRLPVYLETSNVVNLPFYGRHGFELLQELHADPVPRVWTMQTRAG